MEYEAMIQSVLDDIDIKIAENIKIESLARAANYSVYHFCRVFADVTGTTVSAYITRRKLEYALYELAQGRKIIDVAADYGFETHGGFTKAFKKCFGYPPSLYRLHIPITLPRPANLAKLKFYNEKLEMNEKLEVNEVLRVNEVLKMNGGIKMQVQIKEMKPFTIVGYASRHKLPGVKSMSDLVGFYDTINKDYAAELTTLYKTYTRSKHCEVILCMDVSEEPDAFTYMIGVGVDHVDYDVTQRPGTYRHEMDGGLYAVFTTPWADKQHEATRETWEQILTQWLPKSNYEYDETRLDYEYHDERAHSLPENDGKNCIDICIPIREKGAIIAN